MTRRAPILIAIAAVLLTALWWYLLYQPRRVEEAALIEATTQLENERSELQAQILVLNEVRDNEEDYRSQLTRLVEYIPDETGQPDTHNALQRAADESGVEVFQTTFDQTELIEGAPETNDEKTALARIPTLMTITGGYFQVVDLLRRIEVDFTRAVKISSVTMAEEGEEKFPELTVTATGHIFSVLPVLETTGEGVEIVGPEAQSTEAPSDAASEGATEAASEGASTAPADPQTTADEGTS
jgi:Tfp pilus assembly protein PilO